MKLDETGIKLILEEYQNSQDDNCLQRFQEQIYGFIEEWARITYSCSVDISRDFLVYVLEQSQQIMLSYPKNLEVLFKTWFVGVLAHKFSDFSKSKELYSPYLVKDFDFLQELITDHEEMTALNYDQFSSLIEKLPPKEQSVAIFLYMPRDITETHIYHLADLVTKPIHYIVQAYHDILKVQELALQNQEKIQKIQDKLNQKITKLEIFLQNTEDPIKKRSLEQKISYFQNRSYKLSLKRKTKKKILLKIFEELMGDYHAAYSLIRKIEMKIRFLATDFQLGD